MIFSLVKQFFVEGKLSSPQLIVLLGDGCKIAMTIGEGPIGNNGSLFFT